MSLEILRAIFSLIAVLGLIGISALVLKQFRHLAASGGVIRERRLSIVETLGVDARRKLAIIRCDGREHLVLLSAASETIIDSDLPAQINPNGDDHTVKTDTATLNAVAMNGNPFGFLRTFGVNRKRNAPSQRQPNDKAA